MGRPVDPTPAQVNQLNRETALPPAEEVKLAGNAIDLTLMPNSIVLIKIQP
jgi:xylan 1,4-beta-xylosidase